MKLGGNKSKEGTGGFGGEGGKIPGGGGKENAPWAKAHRPLWQEP